MSKESRGDWMRWARFRFSVIGELLASPPRRGELGTRFKQLAERTWKHPVNPNKHLTIGASTIERWYYAADGQADPIKALMRQVRKDAGRRRVMGPKLIGELEAQYKRYSDWSYLLHFQNLQALAEQNPELGRVPSYSTVLRFMQDRGWAKRKPARTKGQKRARQHLDRYEVRSYEAACVHALWHLDFHEASRRVVDERGGCHTPMCLALLDDRSRVCCHAQWYLAESSENLVHGLCQAMRKYGLPRKLMTDNGGAMLAEETRRGLARLGILHATTLPYSPYQNGKQESFWGQVEGRLLAMLRHVKPLTLSFLNRATQAWVEHEYNRKRHEEIGQAPIARMLEGPDVARPAPEFSELAMAFCAERQRTQRRSDGTVSIEGVRFEVPSRLRHVRTLRVRYAGWDLSVAWIVDGRTGQVLARIVPQDKTKNADGCRRRLEAVDEPEAHPAAGAVPLPPLMRKLLAEQEATGLPPAYLPKNERKENKDE
jgi:putative transposase